MHRKWNELPVQEPPNAMWSMNFMVDRPADTCLSVHPLCSTISIAKGSASKADFLHLDVQSRHLMDWVEIESCRLICPAFADELIGREALKCLEAPGEVVGVDEVGEVLPKLVVGVIVEAVNGGLLDGSVHPLDLAVGPRVPGLGEPVVDVTDGAGMFESMSPEWFSAGDHLLDVCRRPAFAGGIGEVQAIVGENRVDLVGNCSDQVEKELLRDRRCGSFMQFDIGKFTGPVDGHEEIEPAFCAADLGDIDVEVADRIGFELLLRRRIAIDVRQATNAVALQAAVQ